MKNTLIAVNAAGHLLVPALLLAWTALGQHRSRAAFVSAAALSAAYLLLIGLGGEWAWFGLWWPWVWYASFPAACAMWLARRGRVSPGWPQRRILPVTALVFTSAIALSLLSAVALVVDASTYEGDVLDLQPPLSGGRFVVAQGGSNGLLNMHAVAPAQRYAIDILALEGTTRAKGVYPDELTAYAIWGRPVIAPCAGTVVAAENALPDVTPSPPSAHNTHPAGNHVILRCGAYQVVLAHLQRGSVAVEVGASLGVGHPLGLVGNSGNTSEPHLHIHAVTGDAAEREQLLWMGTGVPITFGGQFLVRGDTVQW